MFTGVVLAIAVALLVGGLLVVAFFTAAVELVIDDVSNIPTKTITHTHSIPARKHNNTQSVHVHYYASCYVAFVVVPSHGVCC